MSRPFSPATQAIIATGQWCYAEVYDIKLAGSATPISLSAIDSDLVFGTTRYSRGFVIIRGDIPQKLGLQEQTVDLTFAPFADSQVTPLINGKPMAQCIDQGLFDNAEITIWDAFLSSYADTSPGKNHLFMGRVSDARGGRIKCQITITSGIALLETYMPRNIVQTGCCHALFDEGCALNRSAFLVSGSVGASPGVLSFNTSLTTQPDHYFDLGQIDFISGPNAGFTRMVRSSAHSGGNIRLMSPLPYVPASGDSFVISPGCNKTQAQCSQTNPAVGPAFNNIAHFRGFPYVPVVETLYAGGVTSYQQPGAGGQGKPTAGSNLSSIKSRGGYVQ